MAEIFDEEFMNYLDIAKGLITQLTNRTDRNVCIKWIKKLCNLSSDNINVKKYRNNFFKYFLKVIQHQADDEMYGPQKEAQKVSPITRRWSSDHKTYISMQPFPGGLMLYMAVSHMPELGWEPWARK